MKGRDQILTPKERECLLFVANGKSYDYAPDYLGISRNTLLTHLKSIYLKLTMLDVEIPVQDKAQAIYRAIQYKLIPVLPPKNHLKIAS